MGGPEAVVVAPAEGGAEEDGRMEGWLYLIRSNRLGLQTSRKRYFVLHDSALRCFNGGDVARSLVLFPVGSLPPVGRTWGCSICRDRGGVGGDAADLSAGQIDRVAEGVINSDRYSRPGNCRSQPGCVGGDSGTERL